ncbi:hypothetical protein CAEBREN_01468 [Caenorhabditis brenneri]|uniref:Uncharacterized protein n=1 Tax=Caenorhabditis brenneri TaxID=135651 RepID=G0MYI0_CAEBE|nr:hypothetical protein CAEBREN_01468 [Caenorhabditis brenneri]
MPLISSSSAYKTGVKARHVTFNPKTEVREFGNSEVESVQDKKQKRIKIDFTKLRSYSIDPIKCVDLNEALLVDPDIVPKFDVFNETTIAHNGQAAPWVYNAVFKPSKSLALNPQGPITRRLMKMSKEKKLAAIKSEKCAQLKKTLPPVPWCKPTALEHIRGDWRFSCEMESDGEDPADTEMDREELTEIANRKKHLLTKGERVCRQLEIQKAMQRDKFEKYILDFIDKLKNGEKPRVLATNGNVEKKSSELLDFFHSTLETYAATNKKSSKEINFKVRSHINRRLRHKELDEQLRAVYEIISEVYEDAVGLPLLVLAKYAKEKCFKDIERSFLLGL